MTKDSPLCELRAACKFFGVSKSGSKLTCFPRIMTRLRERELKAAAEVAANARKEVPREARGQAIIPVPKEQEKRALTHTPYESCFLHRARQDRRLRTGAARMSGIPVISLDLCFTKLGRPYRSKRSKRNGRKVDRRRRKRSRR